MTINGNERHLSQKREKVLLWRQQVAAEGGGQCPPGRTESGGAEKAEEKKIERKTLKKSLKVEINRGRQTVREAHLSK